MVVGLTAVGASRHRQPLSTGGVAAQEDLVLAGQERVADPAGDADVR